MLPYLALVRNSLHKSLTSVAQGAWVTTQLCVGCPLYVMIVRRVRRFVRPARLRQSLQVVYRTPVPSVSSSSASYVSVLLTTARRGIYVVDSTVCQAPQSPHQNTTLFSVWSRHHGWMPDTNACVLWGEMRVCFEEKECVLWGEMRVYFGKKEHVLWGEVHACFEEKECVL
jgi:hypothetical protein